jgi:hypothetical protein
VRAFGFVQGDILGGGTVSIEAGQRKHLAADDDIVDTVSQARRRHLSLRARMKASPAAIGGPAEFVPCDHGGVDAYQHLTWTGPGRLDPLVDERCRVARTVQPYRADGGGPALQVRTIVGQRTIPVARSSAG